jgi:hypothetical protein
MLPSGRGLDLIAVDLLISIRVRGLPAAGEGEPLFAPVLVGVGE